LDGERAAGDRATQTPAPTAAPARPDPTFAGIITILAILIAFFLVRVLGAPWPKFPPTFPDSFSYLKVAALGPFHFKFYFTERPIGYPLLQWAMGRSATLIVVAQTLIYVAAWVTLGWVVVTALRNKWLALVTAIFIAALAIEPRNSFWTTAILSESLSTALAVFMAAFWLRAATRPSKRAVTWAWIFTGAWILVRDTNVLSTVLVILPAVLVLVWRGPVRDRAIRKRLLVGTAAIFVLCGYVYVSQGSSHRTQYSVYNFTGMRVLPSQSLTDWFVARGMPMSDALRARTGHNAWDDGPKSFLDDPDLAEFRTWAKGPGARWQLISMGVLAPTWWSKFHHELPNILKSNNAEYDTYHVSDRLPKHFPAPLGTPRSTAGLWAWMLLSVAGLAVAFSERGRRLIPYMVTIAMVSAMLDIWTSYVGDPMEVNRHMVGPLSRLCVAMLLAVAFGADALIARINTERNRPPTPEVPEADTEPDIAEREEATLDA
jgi:hypothetical protein